MSEELDITEILQKNKRVKRVLGRIAEIKKNPYKKVNGVSYNDLLRAQEDYDRNFSRMMALDREAQKKEPYIAKECDEIRKRLNIYIESATSPYRGAFKHSNNRFNITFGEKAVSSKSVESAFYVIIEDKEGREILREESRYGLTRGKFEYIVEYYGFTIEELSEAYNKQRGL